VPITLATAAVKTLETKGTAEAMLAAPRYYHPARPDQVVVEDRADAGAIADRLRKSGREVVSVPDPLGRANILICPRGFDAERSLFNVQLTQVEAQNTLFRSLINIYKSMGGGWVEKAETLTTVQPVKEAGFIP